MISLGGVMGAGFFIGSSGAIAMAGPAVLLSYAVAGILIFFVNLILCDLLGRTPRGSFVSQVGHILGPRYGFVMGWTYLLVWITTLAAEIMAAASLIAPLVPLPYWLLELLVLGSMTALNLASVRGYGETEYCLSFTKVAAVVIFIAIGAIALATGHHVPRAAFAAGGLFPHGGVAILSAVPIVVFSMAGTEIGTIAALDSDRPEKNIARLARTIAIRLLGFYLTSVAVILCLLPWRALTPGHSPFLAVLDALHIPFANMMMTVVILAAVLSTLNSGLYASSRILRDVALAGNAPAALRATDSASAIPHRAVLGIAAASAAVAASAILSPTVVFAFLISVVGVFIIAGNMMIVLARLYLVREGRRAALLTLAGLGAVLAAMAVDPHARHELALGLVAIGGIFVLERVVRRRALPEPARGQSAP
ncbi:amino acid permease [Gluconacetobacter takamatsuzukensis]|uniref:Amino acid permease n=2 Tax=Gluconacetobacter takamatsuzukensis TaxID=1286190 RepID=A0A7W4PQ88_9PROT|nr:amino acid permease [Gluconacetobacter takamatsuzukensis]MBB2206275.1 amino acid permease [Gluconacetobacter takamatsuzukensis]